MGAEAAWTVENPRICSDRETGIAESAEGAGVREGADSTLAARAVAIIGDRIAAVPAPESDPPTLTSINNPVL